MSHLSSQMNSSNSSSSQPIRYDDAGRPYIKDQQGQWVPLGYGYLPGPGVMPAIPPSGAMGDANPPSATARPHNMQDGPNQPISFVFQQQPAHGSSSTTPGAAHAVPIDPALLPLPDNSDDDLTDGPTIAKARGHTPAPKKAGARQKTKGKQRSTNTTSRKSKEKIAASSSTSRKRKHISDDEEDEEDEESTKRGRPKGAGNYSTDEVSILLDEVQEELPIGQRGWQVVHRRFTKWARLNGKVERSLKSLETKYKQLVKTTKPTGDAYCPPDVKRAHKIDELINERACTCELNDSDFDDEAGGGGSSDEEVEVTERPKKQPKLSDSKETQSAIIRRPDPTTQRRPRSNPMDLIGKIAGAFDPSAQQARDEERAQRSLHASHIFTLSQQLRDANSTIESLRSQVMNLQSRVHEADRARDRAEIQLNMLETIGRRSHDGNIHRASRSRRSESTKRSLQRVRGKVRCEERYPEGGSYTYWATDPSSSDSDKENIAPPNPANSYSHACSSPMAPPLPATSQRELRVSSPGIGLPASSSLAPWEIPPSSDSSVFMAAAPADGHEEDDIYVSDNAGKDTTESK